MLQIESEMLVKQKALVLAEMQAFQGKRQEEDEKLRQEIDDLHNALNKSVSCNYALGGVS